MGAFAKWVVALCASPLGVVVLAALDSTVFFSLPFGIDAAVVLLAAHGEKFAVAIPLLATTGSIAGAALSFWMGRQVGEKGLDRFVPSRRLEGVRRRVRKTGAIMLAVLDLIPPPFPFTLFVLAAGALEVRTSLFFSTLVVCRLLRFGTEAFLAVAYGPSIVRWIESDVVNEVVGWLVALALTASVVSIVRLIRSSRPASRRAAA